MYIHECGVLKDTRSMRVTDIMECTGSIGQHRAMPFTVSIGQHRAMPFTVSIGYCTTRILYIHCAG